MHSLMYPLRYDGDRKPMAAFSSKGEVLLDLSGNATTHPFGANRFYFGGCPAFS